MGAGGGSPPPPPPPTAPVEAPNTLRSKSIADILCVIGEGPIVVPDDLHKQIYLNGVPLQSSDGTFNFANVSASIALGYPDQAYIPGTAAAETAIGVRVKVTAATPIVQAISDLTATAARLAITIPALVQSDPNTGNRNPSSVAFVIDVQPHGGSYATVVTDTIAGKCISPVQFDYDFPLAGAGPWNVRVRRLTPDSTSSNLLNETHWTSLSVIRDYRLAYPDTAMLRLRIDAEQFAGSFPTIEYQGQFLILEIPSNYDPVARTYDGVWDGTFKTGWTDNPAWVLWAVLTNDRWGLGRWIDAPTVDKWSLYAASQWFDELVSDGKGGTEPRFTFNGSFESSAKAYDAIVALAGACQAMAYWSSGAAHLVVDKPDDPVKQVGPANVVDGKIVYQGSDLATRPTAVHVTWRNPDNSYKRAVEAVENPDRIALHGVRTKEVAALLCTSQGQAARIGRYELETAWSETQTASWGTGADQHDLLPGDHVEVADPSVQGFRRAGRLLAIDGATVTLDDAVTIESDQTYELRVVDETGALQSRTVTNDPGDASVLSITSAFSPPPIIGAVWQLLGSNLAPRRFRVLAIEEGGDGSYGVTAVLHDQHKQARIEGGLILDLPDFTGYGAGPIAAPTDLMIDETIERLPSGAYRHRVTFGWARHPDPRVVRYDVQYRLIGAASYSSVGSAVGTIAELDELGASAYEFRVRAIGYDGAVSPWSTPIAAAFVGLQAAPPDVAGLSVNVLDATALLAWEPVTVANLSHYEVRYSANAAANWESMVPIAPRVSGASMQTAVRTGIYAVKAVTAQGARSVNAAIVITNVTGLTINIVETLVGDPDWNGTLVDVIVDSSRQAIRLAPDVGDFFVDRTDVFDKDDVFDTYAVKSSGTFTWPYFDLGERFTSRVTADLDVFGERTTEDIWAEPDVWALTNIWGDDPTGWDAHLEIRTTDDDPGGAPSWSDWQRLVVSDVRARAIQPRLVLKSAEQTVTPIAKGDVIIDMPDSDRRGADIPIDVSGTRIAFDQAFRGPTRPSIVVTGIEGAAPGDWPEITNVDRTGFDITVRDAASVAQSGRSIDYHAKGYGAVITP